MSNIEEVKKTIEERYADLASKATELNKALMAMRTIEIDIDDENQEEVKAAMALGQDIDHRVAFVLRSLLVQHGNVLFL